MIDGLDKGRPTGLHSLQERVLTVRQGGVGEQLGCG
jgi:hypothetical protein